MAGSQKDHGFQYCNQNPFLARYNILTAVQILWNTTPCETFPRIAVISSPPKAITEQQWPRSTTVFQNVGNDLPIDTA